MHSPIQPVLPSLKKQTPGKRFFSLRWLSVAICLIVIVVGVYSFILAQRILERAFLSSTSAVIDRKPILVGSNGYGQINQIRVQEGQQVAQGDVVFTFLQTAIDQSVKEVAIKTLASGTVTEIAYGVGSYITPDTTVVKLQSRSVLVKAKIKLEPNDISKMQIGSPVAVELPSGNLAKGSVFSIKPTYDKKDKTVEIETSISKLDEEIYNGTPVSIRVYVGDTLAEQVKQLVAQLPIDSLRTHLLKDWQLLAE